MKQNIILHIGHGKTGSSAIQTVLARNHDLLKTQGVLYPDHPSIGEAKRGLVTSGNLDKEDWFEGQVLRAAREHPTFSTLIFSNEHLFNRIDEFLENAEKYRDSYEFRIILFVRNPLEMLISSYQQAIKRGGFFGSIGAFAPHVDHAVRASALVDRLTELGIGFALFNYSRIGRKAVERFFAHLGLWDVIRDQGDWDTGTVNRSLTLAELRFVRDVNRIFGAQYGTLISDALITALPDIPADQPPLDDDLIRMLQTDNAAAIGNLNRHLPPDEQIPRDWAIASAPQQAEAALSAEQADVIRRVFPGALVHADGPILRDIAMKYETADPLTRTDAITLMEYAHKARPQGQIIAGKLAEWRKIAEN